MGILLDKPTIGCAKTRLFGESTPPQKNRGAFAYLLDQRKNKLGVVLRTRDFVQPVYVSPGYKIDLYESIRIILSCTPKYRLPEPLRLAHQLTKKHTLFDFTNILFMVQLKKILQIKLFFDN